jgi:hypothetical protein
MELRIWLLMLYLCWNLTKFNLLEADSISTRAKIQSLNEAESGTWTCEERSFCILHSLALKAYKNKNKLLILILVSCGGRSGGAKNVMLGSRESSGEGMGLGMNGECRPPHPLAIRATRKLLVLFMALWPGLSYLLLLRELFGL